MVVAPCGGASGTFAIDDHALKHLRKSSWVNHSPAATDYAITHNLTPFISMQNHYSLVYREEEREMIPTLQVRIPHFMRVC